MFALLIKKMRKNIKQIMVYYLRILLIGSFLISCMPNPYANKTISNNQLKTIKDKKILLVGTTDNFNGKNVDDIEINLVKEFAKQHDLEVKILNFKNQKSLEKNLNEKEVDIAINNIISTKELRSKFRFTPSFLSVNKHIIASREFSNFNSISELKENKIYISNKSSHQELLEKLRQRDPEITYNETSDNTDTLINQVLIGEIKYTVLESNLLARYRRFYPELASVYLLSKNQPLQWMLKKQKEDSLYLALIEFFGQLHSTGTIAKLQEQYYGHIEDFDYVDTRAYLNAIKNRLPTYEPLFKKYANNLDWRLLAAISYQESHWRPKATSFTGVRGVMMLTLDTAELMGVTNRLDPEQSIMGGSKYIAQLLKKVPSKISDDEKLWFALAAYNLGLGHVLDGIRLTRESGLEGHRWQDVKTILPKLRQEYWYSKTRHGYARGDEAVNYVDNIRRYYESLIYLKDKESKQNLAENYIIPEKTVRL